MKKHTLAQVVWAIITVWMIAALLFFLMAAAFGWFGTVTEDDFCSYNDCSKLNNTKMM